VPRPAAYYDDHVVGQVKTQAGSAAQITTGTTAE
jgi:hypothetical protein